MVKTKKKLSLAEKKEAAQGYLFVTPYLIAFTILPAFRSFPPLCCPL